MRPEKSLLFAIVFMLCACSPESDDAPGALKTSMAAPKEVEEADAPLPYLLPRTEVIPLTSKSNGVDYELYVHLPAGYEKSDETYPLIVTLDADYQFAIVSNQADRLSSHGQAPDVVTVSIGYAGDPDDLDAYRRNRTRDYTPVNTDKGGYGPDIQKLSGGAPAFAAFIAEEALPLLEARYRINAKDRVYVGHSYGGLFGAWLLAAHPDLFHRYIIVSPSLWFNDRMMLDAANLPGPMARKTYVYLGVGAWEEQPDRNMGMVSDLNAYAALIAANHDPNLVVETRVFDDETHASIYPAAFSTGLRHLYLVMDQDD
ncbi:MAG: alpha/beta hydrolase-fold protein [Parvularculaceae bacterium]